MGNIRCEMAKKNKEWANYVVKLIFDEWVKGDELSFLRKKKKMEEDVTVKPYIVLDDEVPVGCFLIVNDDIKGHPEYNPNLACVCVQKEYRGRGYSNYILKYSLRELKKMDIDKAYLKTSLKNFYEKVGWKQMNKVSENETIYELEFK